MDKYLKNISKEVKAMKSELSNLNQIYSILKNLYTDLTRA